MDKSKLTFADFLLEYVVIDKKKAVYAGTFDPFTNGHDQILSRSLEIFDEVTILIAQSPNKKPLFSENERLQMIREHCAKYSNVLVESWNGLLVDYCKTNQIGCIVRGLRPTGDFEIEFQMASMNKNLLPEVETVFLMTGQGNYFVSSTLVKEVHQHGQDIAKFVPKEILKYFKS